MGYVIYLKQYGEDIMRRSRVSKVTASSGNVFRDIGFADADRRAAKAELVRTIAHLIGQRGATQQAAAELLGIDQPKVSNLLRGRLAGFSTERLLGFLTALGRDVQIVVRATPRARRRGRVRVVSR